VQPTLHQLNKYASAAKMSEWHWSASRKSRRMPNRVLPSCGCSRPFRYPEGPANDRQLQLTMWRRCDCPRTISRNSAEACRLYIELATAGAPGTSILIASVCQHWRGLALAYQPVACLGLVVDDEEPVQKAQLCLRVRTTILWSSSSKGDGYTWNHQPEISGSK